MTPRSILVVEDESIVAQDIQSTIKNIGHEVAGWATSAEEAVALTDETRPDVVLMDIRLGGDDDGIVAAEQIRQHFDVPVIFLTAFADEETLARAKLAGPFGYIVKPFDDSDLRAAIDFVNTCGSGHSDAILTEDAEAAREFQTEVDSATVYWNVSTRFTDGFEFGLGAEIGISTDKLHARGPMGLNELTTYKYLIRGHGEIK